MRISPDETFPVKVLYEHYTCGKDGCRKRARFIMDGIGFCPEHLEDVQESLRPFVKRINYQVWG